MKFKNFSTFKIKGLNQEKWLNELCKTVFLSDIERFSKNETSFKCSYFDRKKVEKFLKTKNIEIISISHEGTAHALSKVLTSYGLIFAMVLFFVFYVIQDQFILQYEILGQAKLTSNQVVRFIKDSYTNQKYKINTKEVEIGLLDKFHQISFASCIIRGQTLVVNIKEKLLPDEIYGDFKPIVSKKSAKIKEIKLISGTVNVKVGDFVKEGEVLVEPYTIDTSGNIKKVEAKAEIIAEVYNEGSADHYESFIEVNRTGKVVEQNDITLFGLKIYSFNEELPFKMYDVETEEISLVKNLFLPFKMKKTKYFEIKEKLVETNFEDVKEQFIQKAKSKALEKCENCDTIVEEFYTLRHLAGVTIVNYCIVTLEQIGGYK